MAKGKAEMILMQLLRKHNQPKHVLSAEPTLLLRPRYKSTS
jgi:hypothetical protein